MARLPKNPEFMLLMKYKCMKRRYWISLLKVANVAKQFITKSKKISITSFSLKIESYQIGTEWISCCLLKQCFPYLTPYLTHMWSLPHTDEFITGFGLRHALHGSLTMWTCSSSDYRLWQHKSRASMNMALKQTVPLCPGPHLSCSIWPWGLLQFV